MHIPSVSVRFGLVLEAYCRGNIEHLAPLNKQVEAIRCLGKLADIIKVFNIYTVFKKNCTLFIFPITLLILGQFGSFLAMIHLRLSLIHI